MVKRKMYYVRLFKSKKKYDITRYKQGGVPSRYIHIL